MIGRGPTPFSSPLGCPHNLPGRRAGRTLLLLWSEPGKHGCCAPPAPSTQLFYRDFCLLGVDCYPAGFSCPPVPPPPRHVDSLGQGPQLSFLCIPCTWPSAWHVVGAQNRLLGEGMFSAISCHPPIWPALAPQRCLELKVTPAPSHCQ